MIFSSLDKAGDNGWYIGDFESALFKSKNIEVCYHTTEKDIPILTITQNVQKYY